MQSKWTGSGLAIPVAAADGYWSVVLASVRRVCVIVIECGTI